MMTERETLKKWLAESNNIVFFGGAGVSTESKIPDFRSTDGLYNQQYAYPPETILSHTFYMKRTDEFYRFYRNKMLFPDAEPNRAHKALAKLEAAWCVLQTQQDKDGRWDVRPDRRVCLAWWAETTCQLGTALQGDGDDVRAVWNTVRFHLA